MKKIIILGLALIVIIAVFFLLASKKEKPIEEPVNGVETPTIEPVELPIYLGAEFITRKIQESGDVSYYAVDASPRQVIDFYTAIFPDFKTEEDPVAGYQFYNHETLILTQQIRLRSEKEFIDWKKAKKGLVLTVGVSVYDPVEEYYHELKEYKEELEGKTIILIAHF